MGCDLFGEAGLGFLVYPLDLVTAFGDLCARDLGVGEGSGAGAGVEGEEGSEAPDFTEEEVNTRSKRARQVGILLGLAPPRSKTRQRRANTNSKGLSRRDMTEAYLLKRFNTHDDDDGGEGGEEGDSFRDLLEESLDQERIDDANDYASHNCMESILNRIHRRRFKALATLQDKLTALGERHHLTFKIKEGGNGRIAVLLGDTAEIEGHPYAAGIASTPLPSPETLQALQEIKEGLLPLDISFSIVSLWRMC